MTEIVKSHEWKLEIMSFKGIVPGAYHFRGHIERSIYLPIEGEDCAWHAYERVTLEHQLTAAEAKQLRAKDDWDGWKAGAWHNGFWSEEECIQAAIDAFGHVSDPGDWLRGRYLDDPVYAGVQGEDVAHAWTSTRGGYGNPLENIEHDFTDLIGARRFNYFD